MATNTLTKSSNETPISRSRKFSEQLDGMFNFDSLTAKLNTIRGLDTEQDCIMTYR